MIDENATVEVYTRDSEGNIDSSKLFCTAEESEWYQQYVLGQGRTPYIREHDAGAR
jgi:hypothetical protein